ncbi:MAG: hypothetical protein M2R45_00246 [Verrucomicrobia subdivision 3 bacterium]|nr:hypothetical protein [Limisphaerales bacterium]MCS1412995.1 hypothetical protein [Limisphaerales bacterium]
MTDGDGHSLPLLVQNSRNFSGENEKLFYDPKNLKYNESFILPMWAPRNLSISRALSPFKVVVITPSSSFAPSKRRCTTIKCLSVSPKRLVTYH